MKALLITFMILSSCYVSPAQVIDYDQKIKDANIELPAVPKSLGNYVKAVRVGNLLYLSGAGPVSRNGNLTTGKVGKDLTLAQGYDAAKAAAIGLLAVLKQEVGDLNRVYRIVKVFGLVNCEPDFVDHPKVINGCSDLLVQIFGERGKHARSAIGANSLPGGVAVEIEMIVEISNVEITGYKSVFTDAFFEF